MGRYSIKQPIDMSNKQKCCDECIGFGKNWEKECILKSCSCHTEQKERCDLCDIGQDRVFIENTGSAFHVNEKGLKTGICMDSKYSAEIKESIQQDSWEEEFEELAHAYQEGVQPRNDERFGKGYWEGIKFAKSFFSSPLATQKEEIRKGFNN